MKLSRFQAGASALLCLALLAGSVPASLADVLHFHNGKVVRSKLHRVTGELVEFKGLGEKGTVSRLNLTNRRDVVELLGGEKLFGEILHVDKFRLEIMTPAGRRLLHRWKVKNVVMGTPAQQPVNDYVEAMQQQFERHQQPVAPQQSAVPPVMMVPGWPSSPSSPDHPVVTAPPRSSIDDAGIMFPEYDAEMAPRF